MYSHNDGLLLIADEDDVLFDNNYVSTHVNFSDKNHTVSFKDSDNIQRKWKYDYEHRITQSKIDYAIVGEQSQMLVDKTILDPHMARLETVVHGLMQIAYQDSDAEKQVIDARYVAAANRLKTLYTTMSARIEEMQRSSGIKIPHTQVLEVLKACENDINEAESDESLSQHHSVMRTTPILKTICEFLDVFKNFCAFLDKKIGKMLSGDQSPVFATRTEFALGMFKPAKTDAVAELDKLKTDIQWYCREINSEYDRCARLGKPNAVITI